MSAKIFIFGHQFSILDKNVLFSTDLILGQNFDFVNLIFSSAFQEVSDVCYDIKRGESKEVFNFGDPARHHRLGATRRSNFPIFFSIRNFLYFWDFH